MSVDHRRLAVDLFNHVWTLLRMEERKAEQDDEMIHAAHASRQHWAQTKEGTGANLARGEWQVSHVYATLGRGEPALYHAQRCLAYCEAHPNDLADWDLAYAYEALARASSVAGQEEEARRFTERAYELADGVADEGDRAQLLGDLETLG